MYLVEKKEEFMKINNENIDSFHKGKNYKSYSFMGAHFSKEDAIEGVRFTTWAPKALYVYVVGDFCEFKPLERYKMKRLNTEGLWSLFIPGIKEGTKYKFYILSSESKSGVYKSDPYAISSELRPSTASIICKEYNFNFSDNILLEII